MEKLNKKNSKENVDEAAMAIFKDVLGFRSRYAQGMWDIVIPDLFHSIKKEQGISMSGRGEWMEQDLCRNVQE